MTKPSTLPASEKFGYLRRAVKSRRRRRRGLLDLVQVVDVGFLMLLFFMVNAGFVLQPGISVALPVSDFKGGEPYGALVVTIAQEGMIFFNDERTTLDGLGDAFRQATHDDPAARVLVEADGRVPHAMLVRIYNMAEAAGIKEVTLATRMGGGGS